MPIPNPFKPRKKPRVEELEETVQEMTDIARSRLTSDQLYDTHPQKFLERKLDRIAALGARVLRGREEK